MGAWGRRWLPVTEDLAIRAQLLEDGGPPLWARYMKELGEEHLAGSRQTPAGADGSASEELRRAYEQIVTSRLATGDA